MKDVSDQIGLWLDNESNAEEESSLLEACRQNVEVREAVARYSLVSQFIRSRYQGIAVTDEFALSVSEKIFGSSHEPSPKYSKLKNSALTATTKPLQRKSGWPEVSNWWQQAKAVCSSPALAWSVAFCAVLVAGGVWISGQRFASSFTKQEVIAAESERNKVGVSPQSDLLAMEASEANSNNAPSAGADVWNDYLVRHREFAGVAARQGGVISFRSVGQHAPNEFEVEDVSLQEFNRE